MLSRAQCPWSLLIERSILCNDISCKIALWCASEEFLCSFERHYIVCVNKYWAWIVVNDCITITIKLLLASFTWKVSKLPANWVALLELFHFLSFIPDISKAPLWVHYYSELLPTTALMILCRSWHVEVLLATVSEGLAQGPYVLARVRFEPATPWMQGTELTT